MTVTLGQIAGFLNAELNGDSEKKIAALAPLDQAEPDQLSFLANPKYADQLNTTRAAAVLIHPKQATLAEKAGVAFIVCGNPYADFARTALKWFYHPFLPVLGIHPAAVVAGDASVG